MFTICFVSPTITMAQFKHYKICLDSKTQKLSSGRLNLSRLPRIICCMSRKPTRKGLYHGGKVYDFVTIMLHQTIHDFINHRYCLDNESCYWQTEYLTGHWLELLTDGNFFNTINSNLILRCFIWIPSSSCSFLLNS